jgi:hypothetical protein
MKIFDEIKNISAVATLIYEKNQAKEISSAISSFAEVFAHSILVNIDVGWESSNRREEVNQKTGIHLDIDETPIPIDKSGSFYVINFPAGCQILNSKVIYQGSFPNSKVKYQQSFPYNRSRNILTMLDTINSEIGLYLSPLFKFENYQYNKNVYLNYFSKEFTPFHVEIKGENTKNLFFIKKTNSIIHIKSSKLMSDVLNSLNENESIKKNGYRIVPYFIIHKLPFKKKGNWISMTSPDRVSHGVFFTKKNDDLLSINQDIEVPYNLKAINYSLSSYYLFEKIDD